MDNADSARRGWLFATLLTLACAAGGALTLWLFFAPEGQDHEEPTPVVVNPVRQKAERRLAEADGKAKGALEARLKALAGVFAKGRASAREFAQDALSWSGKWALVSEKIGLSESNAHAKFLSEKFGRHVFTAQELESALNTAVAGYLLDLEAIESAMLVRLRADLADRAPSERTRPAHWRNDQLFRAEYERFRVEVARTLQNDLNVTVAREVGLFVASDVAAQVVLRVARFVAAELGLEAAILGAGASSGIATLGAGLVAAVLLDYLLDAVLRLGGYDPEGDIAQKVRSAIDAVEAAAVEGKGGLRQELSRLHQARAHLRRETVLRLLEPRE